MKVEMKLDGLEGVLNTLKSLPPEIVSKRGGVVRFALRRGALVILNEAKARLADAIAQPGKTGVTQSTGFTQKNVVLKRKAPRGGLNGERFIITVAPRPHPSSNEFRRRARRAENSKRRARAIKSNEVGANDVAFFLEYGTSKQAATPWLRPAFAAKAEESIRTVERELLRGIDRVVKKLAAQNKGK